MISNHKRPIRTAILWLTLGGLCSALLAQQATVASEDGTVVVDGDYVRIETAEGITEVTGDWRTGVGARVADADALLVELGAVRAADHIRLDLAGDVLFDFGKAAVTAAAEEVLEKVAGVIAARAVGDVLVVGHTDAVGDEGSNQRLSEQRALSVIRWLHGRGVPPQLLVARGMGERQPRVHETTPDGRDDPAGRARNRRVELFIGTTDGVDVRAAAGLVTVQSPAGEVRIAGDTVEVAGVRVEGGGVQVGGVRVAAQQGSASCAAGRHCRADCPEGNCTMTCPAGATCDYACRGGDCLMQCSAGAVCTFGCSGGDCRFSCAMGSTCNTSCAGGECTSG